MSYRLTAPAPGWTTTTDVVVVGSGVAGLTVALNVRQAGLRATVVTKAMLDDGSTRWAQGGIAAALGEGDTPEQHLDDTLVAGAGLCDEDAVRALVTEGPDAVRRLIAVGAAFDRDEAGEILLTREGGHHRRRIAHAGGDATGAEISRALVAAVRSDPGVELIEHALVLDLLTDADGHAAGLTLHVMGEGQRDGVGAIRARAVVLATGGMGQVFSATTNPAVSTGDGVALALRAGAEVTDLEFVQFHPTVLWLGPEAEGQQPLVSEAVRGEGAHLVDGDGVRFMVGQHELNELAPRDIVAKAITRRMQEQGAEHMYLDGRHFGAEMWETRFPTILASCRAHGIDPVTRPIPVAPAAHYASGGIRTDLHGRTTVPGLYACGEVACTGVHGANRLASNSLLEGLVFAERIAADLTARHAAGELTERAVDVAGARAAQPVPLLAPEARAEIQRLMTRGAGVIRSATSMAAAETGLAHLAEHARADLADEKPADPRVETWEATNLHLVASALVAAAALREETRGCHWREDFPDRDDATWRRHLGLALQERGELRAQPSPVR
ncbi:L-aspartate oxidase [Kitasatospora paracochleata]|uniref:L-aspartate oxidase n=1 Tax=Kitasatospora paracochleata TaxID=58354 RepID=A0ABT1IWU3_9ACTN|nr:L-aspartate oxidase [Kitasatospora paracochleata]MCP2309620.1 L-aspartate oxidase [Kitasatospora paracochleata]